MRAPGPTRRQGSSRAINALLAVFVGGLAVVAAATLAPIPALADPPPSFSGPWLEVNGSPNGGQGQAAVKITADFWYVNPLAGPGCPATVDFSWDGTLIPNGSVKPPAGLDCNIKPLRFTFLPPTKTTVSHQVTACIVGPRICTPTVTVVYTILPTPTLKLAPKSGLVTAGFTATYTTGETNCGYPDAQFFWNGVQQGTDVILDKSCSATMTFPSPPKPNAVGKYTVKAQAWNGDTPNYAISATYTVLAPPTPTPRPTAKPTATPAVNPLSSVEPSAEPSPSASVEPSLEPSPSVEPSPSSSEAVLSATSPPKSSPSPAAGLLAPPANTSGGNPYVPELATWVGGPQVGNVDPAVVGTNLFLTLLIVFLFGLTAEIFNSTMDSNRAVVHGWWTGLLGGPFRFMGPLVVSGAGLSKLAGSGVLGSLLRVLAVLSLLGLIYGFLSPDFGLNAHSLVLFMSLVIGLGFLTLFSEGSATRLAFRRYRAEASIKLYGTAIFVAIIAVVVSRLVTFQPGLLYGFIASAVIVAPIALARRDDATLVLVPAFGLLVVSVLAWLLLGPVKVMAADGAAGPALAQTILAMIVIGGLEGLFITMMPLRFLDGATVMGWSKIAWALTFGTVTFLWWQLLLNQNTAYVAAFQQTNVQVVFTVLAVFMVTTGGLWLYFRFRKASAEELIEA